MSGNKKKIKKHRSKFDYASKFGKKYSDLNAEEKREYFRLALQNYKKTKVKWTALTFRNNSKEDMFIYLFLNSLVVSKQPFIKNCIFEFIEKHAKSFFDYFPNFQYKKTYPKKDYILTYKGISNTIPAWSRLLGINYETLRKRIIRSKYSVEKAFTSPLLISKYGSKPREPMTKEKLDELIEKIKAKEIDFPLAKPKSNVKRLELDTSYAFPEYTEDDFKPADIKKLNEHIIEKFTTSENCTFY